MLCHQGGSLTILKLLSINNTVVPKGTKEKSLYSCFLDKDSAYSRFVLASPKFLPLGNVFACWDKRPLKLFEVNQECNISLYNYLFFQVEDKKKNNK